MKATSVPMMIAETLRLVKKRMEIYNKYIQDNVKILKY